MDDGGNEGMKMMLCRPGAYGGPDRTTATPMPSDRLNLRADQPGIPSPPKESQQETQGHKVQVGADQHGQHDDDQKERNDQQTVA